MTIQNRANELSLMIRFSTHPQEIFNLVKSLQNGEKVNGDNWVKIHIQLNNCKEVGFQKKFKFMILITKIQKYVFLGSSCKAIGCVSLQFKFHWIWTKQLTTYSNQWEYNFIFYTLFKNYKKSNDSGDNVETYFVGDI